MAVKFAPAEAPPIMNPLVGSAPTDEALDAAHLSASQQSSTPCGKGCSGASLKKTQKTNESASSSSLHLFCFCDGKDGKEKRVSLSQPPQQLVFVPVVHVEARSPQVSTEHPAILVFVRKVPHAPAALVKHDDQRAPIGRRLGRSVGLDLNGLAVPHGDMDQVLFHFPQGTWHRVQMPPYFEEVSTVSAYAKKVDVRICLGQRVLCNSLRIHFSNWIR